MCHEALQSAALLFMKYSAAKLMHLRQTRQRLRRAAAGGTAHNSMTETAHSYMPLAIFKNKSASVSVDCDAPLPACARSEGGARCEA